MRKKLFITLLVLWVSNPLSKDNVYVFYPSVIRPQAVQDKIQKSVQEPDVLYFKSTSILNFVITKLPDSKDGIVALAVKTGGNADKVASALKSADKELCSFFEVDLWK